MARAERRRQERERPAAPARDPVVLALAVVGVLLAAYLTWLKLTGTRAALCAVGSGCDLVQGSRYATLFGVPTAAWGAAFYAAVGGLALAGLDAARRHWAFLLACAGAGVSIYLTYVSVAIIGATCVYCLASTALALALPVVIAARAPAPRLTPARSMIMQGTVVALLAIAVGAGAFAVSGGRTAAVPAGDYETRLARHLRASGAVFYGAFWCPHCVDQKALFGSAAKELPYVECDAKGENPQTERCKAAGVRAFPTWVINGKAVEGNQSLEELARLSGFSPPPAAARKP